MIYIWSFQFIIVYVQVAFLQRNFSVSERNVTFIAMRDYTLTKPFLLSDFVPFFTLLFIIGGSIIITLSYVSWRKYKADKENKKNPKRNVNR